MNNPASLVDEMRYLILARKIRVIGFAIMFGLFVIYGTGLIVAANNINKDMAFLNVISVVAVPIICISSVYLRKARLKKVTHENFKQTYPGIHIVSFFLCDLAGLFCIITNMFINYNFLYATFGLMVSVLYVWLNFPKPTDLDIINSKSKSIPE